LSERVAIVCHDAGGAEILSSWLRRYKYSSCVVVSGPAEKIFKNKCPNSEYVKLEDALKKSSWVLTGTGWQSNFELKAISMARDLGIKTIAFLDHWVNYLERFNQNGNIVLPDELWVGDLEAERIAINLFDKIPILLKPNPYFEDILEEISAAQHIKTNTKNVKVLYVCEPIADHALKQHGDFMFRGYTEQDALRYFLKNISALRHPIDLVNIRPHPSEQKDKYIWVKSETELNIQIGGNKTLIEEIIESDIVVGCESMAMVVALLSKKRVISAIPPGGRSCQLPHNDIEKLQHLIRGVE
jgi:hypothetical protein